MINISIVIDILRKNSTFCPYVLRTQSDFFLCLEPFHSFLNFFGKKRRKVFDFLRSDLSFPESECDIKLKKKNMRRS